MASNRDLIEVCKRIVLAEQMSNQYRELARPLPRGSAARTELYRQATAIDDDVCENCMELRRLANEPWIAPATA